MDDSQKAAYQDQETSSMIHTQLVLVDIRYDGTAVITLNRPQKRNALSAALIADLNAAFQALEENDSVRAIVLTGSPGAPFFGGCGNLLKAMNEFINQFAPVIAGADVEELKHIPHQKPTSV